MQTHELRNARAAQRFLEELELAVKRYSGVYPEEALSDAREHLYAELRSLEQRTGEITNEVAYEALVSKLGSPAEMARGYCEDPNATPVTTPWAAGWRVCCTTCGRSAPAIRYGIVRIAAKSWHKYTIGYCRNCRFLRFVRVIQDLDKPNLTQQLGQDKTPAQVRQSMHRPVATIAGILAFTALIFGVVFAVNAFLIKM